MDISEEGTGLVVAHGDTLLLIDLSTGRLIDVPAQHVESARSMLDAHAKVVVDWIRDGEEWLFELAAMEVNVEWFRWADNPELLGRRTEKHHLLVQPQPNTARQRISVARLPWAVDAAIDEKVCNEVLRSLRRDFVALEGASAYVVVLPKPTESIPELEAAIAEARDNITLAAREAKTEAEKEEKAKAARALHERSKQFALDGSAPDIFVNPYNFVPLPESVRREAPCGHERQWPDRHSGHIEVTWTAKSPLLFGDGSQHGLEADPTGGFRVSGTSLKGSLRSLHEALTGSCLRVFDANFVPVYRQPAAVQAGRQLAVVSEVDRLGRPSKVRLCGAARWARIDIVHAARPAADLRSGDCFEVVKDDKRAGRGREEFGHGTKLRHTGHLDESGTASSGGRWVVLLSDASARDTRHPYYAALGQISTADTLLAPDVADQWAIEVAGAEDLRVRRKDSSSREWKQVTFANTPIGKRREVAEMPEVGDVLWADVQAGRVVKLSASYLWRATGKGSAGERIPRECQSCGSPDLPVTVPDGHLCVSCRLFGSAGSDRKDDREGARQRSYRGQVRVSELCVVPFDGALVEQELPPRGRPRPGSGQFSLEIGNTAPAQSNEHLPAAAWGSRQETAPPRQIRGRKFYWHGHTDEAQGGWRRDGARGHQARRTMGAQKVKLVPVGSEVRATVWFENLTDAELGSLIGVLDPTAVLRTDQAGLVWRRTSEEAERSRRLHTHLGGGKGLGLGSVELAAIDVRLESPDRYRGTTATALAAEQHTRFVDAFRRENEERMAATWKELAAMLDPDRVDPKRVAYPPNRTWDTLAPDTHQEFDQSFEFFGKTNGAGHQQNPEPIEPLPQPSSPTPWLTIREGH